MKKYEVAKSNDFQKINNWFDYCSNNQIPYVIVKIKTKYATIEWDYINLNPIFDKIFVSNGDNNKQLFLEIFNKYANNKSEYTISNLTLFVKNITIENSTLFAEEVFDVIKNNLLLVNSTTSQ